MTAPHRRRHVALEQLFLARLHDRKPYSPDPATQQVHAEQSRDEEIDVAGARRGCAIVANRDRILPAARALEYLVHLEPREAALGAGRVVAVDDRSTREYEERDPPGAQPQPAACRVEHARHDSRR